jgi:LPXTG-motif cell wall-anchored protein
MFMLEKQTEEVHNTERKIAARWKVLQALGGILIGLGLFIDWPAPPETNLPDTSSFLMIVGALVVAAGLLLALRRE